MTIIEFKFDTGKRPFCAHDKWFSNSELHALIPIAVETSRIAIAKRLYFCWYNKNRSASDLWFSRWHHWLPCRVTGWWTWWRAQLAPNSNLRRSPSRWLHQTGGWKLNVNGQRLIHRAQSRQTGCGLLSNSISQWISPSPNGNFRTFMIWVDC